MTWDDLLFEVETPLGIRVRCTRWYWAFITAEKHPTLAGRERDVRAVSSDPDEVRRSRKDPAALLMDKIRVIHDAVGHTLTVWLDEPRKEHVCEETADEVVSMKDVDGRVIGVEPLHCRPAGAEPGLSVETVVRTAG